MSSNSPSFTYADAGVDIAEGEAFVDDIRPLAAATRRAGCLDAPGGFAAMFSPAREGYTDPVILSATDGVGTKLKLAIESERHTTVGIDLVAMCVNDLVCQGGEPLFFLDYFASGHLDRAVARDVVAGIAEGCQEAGCALVGGETAEMPGMYGAGDYDLAGFAVGAAGKEDLLPRTDITAGDRLIGISASGLHSNGFSLVRRILEARGTNLFAPAPFSPGSLLCETLLTPTRIYIKPLLPLIRAGHIKAAAHITGGGLPGNLPRILPSHTSADVDITAWEKPPVFPWIQKEGGVSDRDMYATFNMGVGMVLVVAPDAAETVMRALTTEGEVARDIGRLIPAGG